MLHARFEPVNHSLTVAVTKACRTNEEEFRNTRARVGTKKARVYG